MAGENRARPPLTPQMLPERSLGWTTTLCSLVAHLTAMFVYFAVAARGNLLAVPLTVVLGAWPLVLLVALAAAAHGLALNHLPRARPGRVFARGLLVELPILVLCAAMPGWLVLLAVLGPAALFSCAILALFAATLAAGRPAPGQ